MELHWQWSTETRLTTNALPTWPLELLGRILVNMESSHWITDTRTTSPTAEPTIFRFTMEMGHSIINASMRMRRGRIATPMGRNTQSIWNGSAGKLGSSEPLEIV